MHQIDFDSQTRQNSKPILTQEEYEKRIIGSSFIDQNDEDWLKDLDDYDLSMIKSIDLFGMNVRIKLRSIAFCKLINLKQIDLSKSKINKLDQNLFKNCKRNCFQK